MDNWFRVKMEKMDVVAQNSGMETNAWSLAYVALGATKHKSSKPN